MNTLKEFEEYIKTGIVKKKSPDINRANSLIKESTKNQNVLNKIISKMGIDNENSNLIIKNTYDIIMEKIRSKMMKEGYFSHGKGAHEAEVAYLRKLKFPENDVQFLNQLRYFRNGITYYGKSFDKEYAQKVTLFLKKIYNKFI